MRASSPLIPLGILILSGCVMITVNARGPGDLQVTGNPTGAFSGRSGPGITAEDVRDRLEQYCRSDQIAEIDIQPGSDGGLVFTGECG